MTNSHVKYIQLYWLKIWHINSCLRVSFSLCTTYTCMKSQCFFTVEFKEFDNTAKEKISKVLQQFSRFCCFLWVWETVPFLFVYQFFVLRRILFYLQQWMLEPECWKAELKSTKQIFSEQKDILLLQCTSHCCLTYIYVLICLSINTFAAVCYWVSSLTNL